MGARFAKLAIARVKRPIQNYNVENRAHKIISKEKPARAPLREAEHKLIDKMRQERPDFLKKHNIKDTGLDNRLKKVYITSTDPEAPAEQESDRPLPRFRWSNEEYPIYDVGEVPEGKLRMDSIQKIIVHHNADAKKNSAAALAEQYRIDVSSAENLIKYYRIQAFIAKKEDKMYHFSSEDSLTAARAKLGMPPDGLIKNFKESWNKNEDDEIDKMEIDFERQRQEWQERVDKEKNEQEIKEKEKMKNS